MMRLIAPGTGAARDVVLGYHLGAFDVLRDAIWPEACLLVDADGHYTSIGSNGVQSIEQAIAIAQELAGGFTVRSVTLIGWSAGCQALRAHLMAGEKPDAVIALDGTSGSVPAQEWQIAPWRDLAERARNSECLAVLTYTQQRYTEELPSKDRYAWTGTVVNVATGVPLDPGGPIDAPAHVTDGGLHVLSYASKRIDRDAHIAQQREALPWIVERILRPHLDEGVPCLPKPEPIWRDSSLTLGERCVLLSLEEYRAGVKEEPKGSNTSPRIREYLAPAYRYANGQMLNLKAANWCAAAACWVARQCSLPGEVVPHPYVVSGLEIEQAAEENDCWRPAGGGYIPKLGDIVILARGQKAGWERHVARVETPPDEAGNYRTIDGNHGDAWGLVPRSLANSDLIGFVSYPDLRASEARGRP